MMKQISLFAIGMLIFGCGSSETADTKDAGAEVQKMSSQGGALPDPNLPQPMGASGGGAGKKTGKFAPAGG